jgi:hypothetical protein
LISHGGSNIMILTVNFCKTLAILAAFAPYAATGGLGGSWVLCIGADGHISVEAEGARCCQANGGILEGCTEAWRTEGLTFPGCNPCTDIPLVMGSTEQPAAQAPQAQGTTETFLCLLPVVGPVVALPRCHSSLGVIGRSTPGGGMLTHLRTVVLRC